MKKNPVSWFLLLGLALPTGGFWYAFFVRILNTPSGERADFFTVILLVSSVLLTICITVLYEEIFAQLDDLEEIIKKWDNIAPKDVKRYLKRLHGPIGKLANTFNRQMERINGFLATIQETTKQETERKVKRELMGEIRRSILPDRQMEFPSHENFAVAPLFREGFQRNCNFYDCFSIDSGMICLLAGETPNDEVSSAISLVMAQTTLRIRLRMGRPLVDAMADVNTQMFDYGTHSSVGLLAGALDILSGKMTLVNAGGCPPLLMRNGQAYEWLDIPPSAPLGQNQRVSYRAVDLRLRQGDRIFFHTRGLGEQSDEDGILFRDGKMLKVLNRGRDRTPEESLDLLRSASDTFSSQIEKRNGFSALLLEYRKGDRELMLCRLPAAAESVSPMLEFLKGQFAQAGIQRHIYARLMVLSEELFSLCVRKAEPGSVITVECGVAPDGESVNIRMTGKFQGTTPLSVDAADRASMEAAEFIANQADYVQFKSSGDQDVVTMVYFFNYT